MPEDKGWNIHLREPEDHFAIPFDAKTTTLLVVYTRRKEIRQFKAPQTKLWALLRLTARDIACICWPGRWSQDVFYIADPMPLIQQLKSWGYTERRPRWTGPEPD